MRKNVANNVNLFNKLLVFMINSCSLKIKNNNNALIYNQRINKLVILKINSCKNKTKIWKIIISNCNFKDS